MDRADQVFVVVLSISAISTAVMIRGDDDVNQVDVRDVNGGRGRSHTGVKHRVDLRPMSALLSQIPSLEDMAGDWVDLTIPPSPHVNASAIDLPIVSNFHGSVGSNPGGEWIGRTTGGAHQVITDSDSDVYFTILIKYVDCFCIESEIKVIFILA